MVNAILAKRVNHIVTKGDNPAWPKGSKSRGFSTCCEMGYISETDAWKYIDIAYNMVHAEFSSWEDMAMSYIIGRSLWGGKGAYNSVMKSTADELLTHVNSPWRKYTW